MRSEFSDLSKALRATLCLLGLNVLNACVCVNNFCLGPFRRNLASFADSAVIWEHRSSGIGMSRNAGIGMSELVFGEQCLLVLGRLFFSFTHLVALFLR